MENDVLLTKIESIHRCIKRIKKKRPENVKDLKSDFDLQDIISVNLERAIQISVDIALHIIADSDFKSPNTMGESFIVLSDMEIISKELGERLRKGVGFRNISVHAYEKINWDIVFSIINKNLDDFQKFAELIMKHVSE